MSSSNSNRYNDIPEHMGRAVRISMKRSGKNTGMPLRSQTLRLLKSFSRYPLKLDFKKTLSPLFVSDFSNDFIEKLRTVIPTEKDIEKEVMQLVLRTWEAWEAWVESGNDNDESNFGRIQEYRDLKHLIENSPDILIYYRDQLLMKKIIRALGITVSELRPNNALVLSQNNNRDYRKHFTTTKAFITHKNPLNRPSNQVLITNKYDTYSSEDSFWMTIRFFLWPIYYKKNKRTLKVPYKRKIVPAIVNPDYITLNNFKNGEKVIGYGDPKYNFYISQNSFIKLAKMTPAEAFYLKSSKNNNVPLFRHPTNRSRFVTQHELRFVTLNMNVNRRYTKPALKIQSLYRGGKYRTTQIKIANAAEKTLAAANRAAQIAREKFNQAKKVRDVITKTKKRKKSPSKNNNSPSKRRALRANAATARATASKRRSP
jgi:hypothetical protein